MMKDGLEPFDEALNVSPQNHLGLDMFFLSTWHPEIRGSMRQHLYLRRAELALN